MVVVAGAGNVEDDAGGSVAVVDTPSEDDVVATDGGALVVATSPPLQAPNRTDTATPTPIRKPKRERFRTCFKLVTDIDKSDPVLPTVVTGNAREPPRMSRHTKPTATTSSILVLAS